MKHFESFVEIIWTGLSKLHFMYPEQQILLRKLELCVVSGFEQKDSDFSQKVPSRDVETALSVSEETI